MWSWGVFWIFVQILHNQSVLELQSIHSYITYWLWQSRYHNYVCLLILLKCCVSSLSDVMGRKPSKYFWFSLISPKNIFKTTLGAHQHVFGKYVMRLFFLVSSSFLDSVGSNRALVWLVNLWLIKVNSWFKKLGQFLFYLGPGRFGYFFPFNKIFVFNFC